MLAVVATLALAACNNITNACSSVLGEGISLQVRDSVSDVVLRHDSTSSLIYRLDGGVPQSSSVIYPDRLAIFGSGTFDLTLNKPGYRTWTRSGVKVEKSGGSCGQPISVSLIARLVKS